MGKQVSDYKWLVQSHQGEDANLCGFFALYHYFDGQSITKDSFKITATQYYVQQLGVTSQLALQIVLGGNDPTILGCWNLAKLSASGFDTKSVLIVADTSAGHFYCVRKIGNDWWSFNSYNLSKPTKLGDSNATKKAVSGEIWG